MCSSDMRTDRWNYALDSVNDLTDKYELVVVQWKDANELGQGHNSPVNILLLISSYAFIWLLSSPKMSF
ncbi:unnamed protein product [Rodentolepis nana]|uniref:Phospholipase D/transphosphatidylase n=1 Tax=Rodentolepis nana TaxID=102285 RepID=A0A0R3THN7_RODNA|nr:unnamed protein product [Rodentolepis nana]